MHLKKNKLTQAIPDYLHVFDTKLKMEPIFLLNPYVLYHWWLQCQEIAFNFPSSTYLIQITYIVQGIKILNIL